MKLFLYSRVDHFIAFYRSWVTNYAFRAKRCHVNFQIQLKTIDLSTKKKKKTTVCGVYYPHAEVYCVKLNFNISKLVSFNCKIVYQRWNFVTKFRSNLSPIILTLWYENKHGGTVNKVDFKHIWSTFSRWQLSVLMRLKTGRERQ